MNTIFPDATNPLCNAELVILICDEKEFIPVIRGTSVKSLLCEPELTSQFTRIKAKTKHPALQ